MTDIPFDPGLQPERTLLAWRRTALALAVAFIVGGRLTAPTLGIVADTVAVLGLMTAACCYLLAAQRYRADHENLTARRPLGHGAVPLVLLAGGVAVLGLGGLVYVVALGR